MRLGIRISHTEFIGDVVRIAPNELVFITPEAYTGKFGDENESLRLLTSHHQDIYASVSQGRPCFIKSDMLEMGEKYEGLASERDVGKHRAARKQLAPAFSQKALLAYQARIHDFANQLILKFEEEAAGGQVFDIVPWFERITTDIGGAIALNHDLNNVRHGMFWIPKLSERLTSALRIPLQEVPSYDADIRPRIVGKHNPILASLLGVGKWTTIRVIFRRFPMISWLSYLFLSPKTALSYYRGYRLSTKLIEDRVRRRHEDKQPDYLGHFIGKSGTLPPKGFLVSQAAHLIFDHFESSSVLSAAFYFLTTNKQALKKLQDELRRNFRSLDEITDDALSKLSWIHAIIEETLRCHTNVPYGLPRISPGHTIDGNFIPKGVRL
ncbi:hypothetical protein E4U42_004434 [Claviceps africana]|uniref:Cytochrome P450 n=1 Tax=Claviceps africana TaxID=83212 RepID=A0A8K0JEL2_9HYPO|nr:hypothetical protein E4U42_004434 [Claviceps africana]